jgi:hypothetical protein
LRLEENNNPIFEQLDRGLNILLQEINYCL